ncbi:hypothetical protein DEO23_15565 [Brachybacterium endophyticum]|uniref:Uncharacterized protein n=1 Tax=Brachybacterium endophyticum TaxID=2182385 RepID=A0A2U2RGH1_9MICO|nr:PPA1309 family protein [Brachybacterium endophyticum]PWH04950.1 hypothetical protein DEO23_15565 [Brachybacterium endophyticum]
MSETPLDGGAPESSPADDLDPAQAALAAALLEVLRHVEEDAEELTQVRWFALLRSAQLLAEQPSLAAVLGDDVALSLAQDSQHLTSVELEAPPATADPLESLSSLEWPEGIAGLAGCFDLSPAQREERSPLTGADGSAPASASTDGQRMRAAVAALEDGTVFCAVRRGDEEQVALGVRLLPDVTEAIRQAVTEEE